MDEAKRREAGEALEKMLRRVNPTTVSLGVIFILKKYRVSFVALCVQHVGCRAADRRGEAAGGGRGVERERRR